MSTSTRQAPWQRYKMSQKEWEALSPEDKRKKRYERWYQQNREKRNKARRTKYHKDKQHRQKVLQACKDRRPARRAELAEDKFVEKVEAARERAQEQVADNDSDGGGRKGLPRLVEVDGQEMWVFTSRKLALECGRGQSTVRRWLNQGVLPGCTIIITDRYYFSNTFIEAVREACRLVYYEDGNGSQDVLGRLIREQLAEAGCSYVPPNGSEKDRVRL